MFWMGEAAITNVNNKLLHGHMGQSDAPIANRPRANNGITHHQ
jgi:hypothetical protein